MRAQMQGSQADNLLVNGLAPGGDGCSHSVNCKDRGKQRWPPVSDH